MRPILLIILIAWSSWSVASTNTRIIPLKKMVTLNVYIYPLKGARFIFPFVLDDPQNNSVPFTMVLSNPAFRTTKKTLKGRNFFFLNIQPKYTGNVIGTCFVDVDGHHITMNLHVTHDIHHYISNYVFKLSKADREKTIREIVNERIAAMKSEYKQKEDNLDILAQNDAFNIVGKLAMKGPSTTNIMLDKTKAMSDGQSVTLYLDKAKVYGKFVLFDYTVTNNNTMPLVIQNAMMYETLASGNELPVSSGNMINKIVKPGQTADGVLTTDQTGILNASHIRLAVQTDKGKVSVKW